jgi:diaminopimelate decarboxylase
MTDFKALAEQFGTPCYVYDGRVLREDFARLRAALHPDLEIFYSLKANPNISVFAMLCREGARAEVSSLAELRTALLAGIGPQDVIFLGPGKSQEELVACVETGIRAIVAESLDEVERIDEIAAGHGRTQGVLLRINPAHSPSAARLAMGGKPRQFGIDEDLVLAEGTRLTRFGHARLDGIHVYLGTRILDAGAVVDNTRYILDLAERVAARTGVPLRTVDIGGGLGVPYFENESELDLDVLARDLNPVLAGFRAAHPDTRLILEAGRFLVARCGTYVVSVRTVKTSRGECFAVTDGGTHQHMAAVGIGSFVKRDFPVALLDTERDGPLHRWHVTGPLCTPNDVIAKAAALPALRPGDLLGVLMSGAYGPTASPGLFLGHGHPAEILLYDGRAQLVRSRDSVEDVLARQILCSFDTEAAR